MGDLRGSRCFRLVVNTFWAVILGIAAPVLISLGFLILAGAVRIKVPVLGTPGDIAIGSILFGILAIGCCSHVLIIRRRYL